MSTEHDILPRSHKEAVEKIATQSKDYSASGTPYRIYHGGTNSTRPPDTTQKAFVDTSSLSNVLEIDTARSVVIVEPNVSMSELVDATLPYGLLPPVVPEFPAITVGGAYAGTAGESSSWKHGFFDRTVNWVEIVLPDGTVLRASAQEHTDLFHGAAGAMGTLGVATCFSIQLEPTKRYVEVSYIAVRSAADAVATLQKCIESASFDFIDGIIFTRDAGVIIAGRVTDAQTHPLQCFSYAYHPWFYLHASAKCKQASANPSASMTDTVPIRDYLFRYDRGAFWMGAHAFTKMYTPFNFATHTFLNPLLHTKGLYGAMHASGYSQRFIIQDLILPDAYAAGFCAWTDERLGVYPLWLCPIRAKGNQAPMHASANPDTEMFCNVGVWGHGRQGYGESDEDGARWLSDNEELEAKVAELGGKKWLYAQVFAQKEEDFWKGQGCDRRQYEALREKYGAQGTMSAWDKVKRRKGYGTTSKLAGVLEGLRLADWRWGPPDVEMPRDEKSEHCGGIVESLPKRHE